MPNTIAQNKFAVHCGVSRQGIAWAVQNKLIAVYKKKINIDHRLTCEYYHKQTGKTLDPAKLMKKVVRKKKAAPKKKAVSSKSPDPVKPAPQQETTTVSKPEPITAPIDDTPEVNPDIDLDKLNYENGYTLPDGINCFEDITIHNLHKIPGDLVKKVKELEVAKKAKQDRDVKRGKLIDREVVFKFISQLYIIDVNQVKTQEDRLVPGLCGVFGVEDGSPESIEARKLIKNDSADLLESIQREVDDYLAGMVKVK